MKNAPYVILILLAVAYTFLRFSLSSPSQSRQSFLESDEGIETSQVLPVSAKAMVDDSEILLEVAETPEQQAKGLMFRSELPHNRGMLFPVEPERKVQLWMKNVELPLDIIFIKDEAVQSISERVPTCSDDCPLVKSNHRVDYVIEVSGGTAQSLGLRPGDNIEIVYLSASNSQ